MIDVQKQAPRFKKSKRLNKIISRIRLSNLLNTFITVRAPLVRFTIVEQEKHKNLGVNSEELEEDRAG